MTQYHSKPVSQEGWVEWSLEEDAIWHDLVKRQLDVIDDRACEAYLHGLTLLDLPLGRVPQLPEINKVLKETTGWQVQPVPALIDFDRFFDLLANKRFPVATFLRTRDEFDYLQEPDFFHEIFGHCAMLTNPDFAAFTEQYGKLGQAATSKQRGYLARLYWFTVEFGLVKEGDKLKIYGGGILSSPAETNYALEGDLAVRERFDLQTVLRTPYRIDIMQPKYYVINDLAELFQISQENLLQQADLAIEAGLLPPLFEPKEPTHVE
ncbi:Phenylalanine-4-hydroxylase [Vibrio chagasii]|uniref:phenylalanine 4-monooxygenase n=1 Tax=Vibrio sp. T3Y01 TaxID=2607606 RepID=UPI00149382B2|nr:phenylalanine 4-monooxygenase [Vibrio sp. T3Y01]CAH6838227.1 Phenylalanine-4-hydroxylase [Vibrio chagasii]NOI94044.1 phenylalanine 4-monooxygenase [Vibrio sp. T3Y01]CAH6855514.1 Phenylalanine-4-hydroxylase [Vibrio chagasii]CAH6973075.1 Phenylalanine-4-hydroxylase [Vibrio chagasii]CAH7091423.1 Phenylalanine-4-hydroxylase [Vibrio chagasii]